jgi:hypothetical protein
MAADDWEQPEAGAAGPKPDDPQGGAHASFDELLRDAAEARDPEEGDDPKD